VDSPNLRPTENATHQTHNAPIKAVLFDLGETLLNFGRIKPTEIFTAGAKSSYNYLKSMAQPVGNLRWYALRNLMSLRIRRWLSALRGRDFDALQLLKRVGSRKGIKLTPEQWQHLTWLWYEPLRKISWSEPDITETLTALKDSGLKLGILSNTFVHGSSLDKHMEQVGILRFFNVRVYSYELPFRKPDVRIFKIAAERIGEAFENILFVGDRIDKDVRPALRNGMFAVLKNAYTNAGKHPPPGAKKIAQISELPGLIEQINKDTPAG